MYCPKCGKQCQDQSKYCPGCGASLENGGGYSFELNRATIRVIVIAALLILSMIMWQKELVIVDAYFAARGTTGAEVLGVSGIWKLLINCAYIASAVLLLHPVFTGRDIEKKNYLPAAVVSCGMVAALAIGIFLGIANLKNEYYWADELADIFDYVEFSVHTNGWILILSCAIIVFLTVKIHQEIEYYERYGGTDDSIVVHSLEGEVVAKKADLDNFTSVERITVRQANGIEKVLQHDKMDGLIINVGEKCYVKFVGDKVTDYKVK